MHHKNCNKYKIKELRRGGSGDKNLTSTLLTVHAVRIKGGVLINPPLAYANFNITKTPPFLRNVPLHYCRYQNRTF